MTLNCVKLWRQVTFMKYLASVVYLIFLPKTLMRNKTTFPASNSLTFAELLENEHMKNISKKFTNTVKPLYSGHHRNLKIVFVIERCPLRRGSS